MKFITLDSLSVSTHWYGVRTSEVALRQGSLDGACGPYALMNALMLGGHISRTTVEKLWNQTPDGRTVFGRWSKAHPSLISSGTEADQLRELLRGVKSSVGASSLADLDLHEVALPFQASNQQRLSAVASHVDENRPVLVCLEWNPQSAHWAVVVGYQSYLRELDNTLAQLLVVDSGGEAVPEICAWNATVGLGGEGAKRLRYVSLGKADSTNCKLTEAYVLTTDIP